MAHAVSVLRIGDDDAQRQRMEALVIRHLQELFNRLPTLAGFRLRSDLMVADVALVSGSPDRATIRRLQVIVMRTLVELAECHPEAVHLMRGRTFARTLH
jgi:hypothetical protein